MRRGQRERWPTKAHWEHVAAPMDPGVIGGTILAWQPVSKEPLTAADAAEIDHNVREFIDIMTRWKAEAEAKAAAERPEGDPPPAPMPRRRKKQKPPP